MCSYRNKNDKLNVGSVANNSVFETAKLTEKVICLSTNSQVAQASTCCPADSGVHCLH